METIFDSIISNLGGVAGIIIAIVGWVVTKYVLPLIKSQKAEVMARHIALIADDVTDSLVMKYPESKWAQIADEAIDQIMAICDINKQVAERAAQAAMGRKSLMVVEGGTLAETKTEQTLTSPDSSID